MVKYHEGADDEVAQAVGYYARIDPDLAVGFAEQLEEAVSAMSRNPRIGSPHPRLEDVRYIRLRRFPYKLGTPSVPSSSCSLSPTMRGERTTGDIASAISEWRAGARHCSVGVAKQRRS